MSIIVQAPRQGISQSPHVGFGQIRNLDITSVPGIVALNNIQVKKSSTTITDNINWTVRHPITTSEVYALGDTGKVYKSSDSGATWALMTGFTAGGHGNGMIIFKNYLIVARDAFLDICGDGTATGITNANWSNSWKAIDSDTLWHPMIISKNDGKVYGGAGRFVFSLDENTGQTFAPGTAASFTFTSQALDLPSPYRIKCLEELGNNLMCGTWQGTAMTDIRVADIFPWDRSSVSFGQPIVIDDYGVHAMKNTGVSLVVLAGTSGTIRRSSSVTSNIIGQIPTDIRGGKYIEFYPGSICSYKNKVFFGTGNGGSTAVSNQGIYSINETGQGNILSMEHSVSTLNDGSTNSLKVTSLLPITRDTLLTGWRDNTTYGIDLTTATSYAYTTDYSGYFETPLYSVGSTLNLVKYKEIEFQCVRPLRTGEGIKIEYRTNLTNSYTTLNTYDYTNWGDIVSKNSTFIVTTNEIPACEIIQLKISLLGSATTSPELKSITLR